MFMKLHTKPFTFWFLLYMAVICGVVAADIGGLFAYSDAAFVIVFFLYLGFVLTRGAKSKTTFVFTLVLLFLMGVSYIAAQTGVATERIGEWLYLFFLFGIIQYSRETESDTTSITSATLTNWDTYYAARMGTDEIEGMKKLLLDHARWYLNWLGFIDKKISIFKKSLRVFEIGSGMGGVITLLNQHPITVAGSDISQEAKRVFQTINPEVLYYICDIQRTVPPGSPYDRVLAFEVLEHLDKLTASVGHIKKALVPGGYFVGTTPYPYTHHLIMPSHINVHGPDFWKKLFLSGGFSSVETYPMSLPPFLWRIHPRLNFVLPIYIPFPLWISTTLIIAKK